MELEDYCLTYMFGIHHSSLDGGVSWVNGVKNWFHIKSQKSGQVTEVVDILIHSGRALEVGVAFKHQTSLVPFVFRDKFSEEFFFKVIP